MSSSSQSWCIEPRHGTASPGAVVVTAQAEPLLPAPLRFVGCRQVELSAAIGGGKIDVGRVSLDVAADERADGRTSGRPDGSHRGRCEPGRCPRRGLHDGVGEGSRGAGPALGSLMPDTARCDRRRCESRPSAGRRLPAGRVTHWTATICQQPTWTRRRPCSGGTLRAERDVRCGSASRPARGSPVWEQAGRVELWAVGCLMSIAVPDVALVSAGAVPGVASSCATRSPRGGGRRSFSCPPATDRRPQAPRSWWRDGSTRPSDTPRPPTSSATSPTPPSPSSTTPATRFLTSSRTSCAPS